MNADEIKQLLSSRAEEVCRELLPGGKRVNHEWVTGDINCGPGSSLKVALDGEKAGYWKDWGNDAHKGSLIDLWMFTKGINFSEALKQAAAWLHVDLSSPQKQLYQKPVPPQKKAASPALLPLAEGDEGWIYLTEKRGIKPETIKLFGICRTWDGKAIAFPYRSAEGNRVEMVKFLQIERLPDGGKKCWTTANSQPALFGKETVKSDNGIVVICEGEIDAMTIRQAGFSALSVPYGAKSEGKDGKNPNDPWISHDYDFLGKFQEIYLCFDADDPGRKAAAGLAKRLGIQRCRLMRLPEDAKDPNELLMQDRTVELAKSINEAKSLDPDYLKGVEEFMEAVWERFYPKDGAEAGVDCLWPMPFRIRPGETTIVTGYSGHGKTMLLTQLLVHLVQHGMKCCIASMEIPADMTLQNMWSQASALKKPADRAEFEKYYRWFFEKIWLYDRMGDVDPREVISVFMYAARRYGVNIFVVDSLDKLNVGRDDYDKQKQIMSDLCALAKDMGAHVFLVAHSRKPDHNDESNIPGKYDVSGSAAITNLAWNGLTVWRNKKKEESLKPDSPDYEEDAEERERIATLHDACFRVWKQREPPGEEPWKMLWYDRNAKQFHDRRDYEGNKVYAI